MNYLKLMADYECSGLWVSETGRGYEHCDPEDLPISGSLASRIEEWAEIYDKTLNREDPINSGFVTQEAHAQFVALGRKVASCLSEELGDGWTVSYFNDQSRALEKVS